MRYPRVILKAPRQNALIKKHHPWIFSQAIEKPKDIPDGGLCDVFLSDGNTFFARGYYNSRSQIAVRLLCRDPGVEINQEFFVSRFLDLKRSREALIDTTRTNAYRLVFAESDGLPGLVLDRYDKAIVMQVHTAGMERLKTTVAAAVVEVFRPATIHERSDLAVRKHEGLADSPNQHLSGEEIRGEIAILENGISFAVDIRGGQKTGFFLDQRENRAALERFCAGKHILNGFAYTGAFSVYAALASAAGTTSVDSSAEALKLAQRNFAINQIPLDKHVLVEADVFDYLIRAAREKRGFDLVTLDPPAFVKERRAIKEGLAGYLRLNELALKLLPAHGILATSSCSAFVTDEMFQRMLTLAANRARCALKVVEIRHQPSDHPFNLHFPEGKYLKFWICEKA